MRMDDVMISIIIPTHNREQYLKNMLMALTKQTIDKGMFEVIIIDNGSTDDTSNMCKYMKQFFPNYRYIYEGKPGLHNGRHLGYRLAKADYLLYADDDIEPSETWIEGILEGFENGAVLVGGNVVPKFEGDIPRWYKQFIYRSGEYNIMQQLSLVWSNCNEMRKINPYFVFGCNYGVRKDVITQCKGFHPDSMPSRLLMYRGDGESYVSFFIMSQKMKALFSPKATVYHVMPKERLTDSYLEKRGKNDGISEMYTVLREKNAKKVLSLVCSNIKDTITKDEYEKKYKYAIVKGNIYLLLYYIGYKRIRVWVNKETYMPNHWCEGD